MRNIQSMLKELTSVKATSPLRPTDNSTQAQEPEIEPPPNWPALKAAAPSRFGMSGVELFPESGNETRLALLSTPTKPKAGSKRRKPASPQSNLSPQYNALSGSSGGPPC